MKRLLILVYGIACYLAFGAACAALVWFVHTLDLPAGGERAPRGVRIGVDAILILLFALQHSIMARRWFKRAWTRVIPPPVERSTYVLFASLLLMVLVGNWQPLPTPIWRVESALGARLLHGLAWIGWTVAALSSLLADHFDFLGLKQVWSFYSRRDYTPPRFKTPGPYRIVRHPIYLGFLIAFWSAPTMTAGHLFFSGAMTTYIFLAVHFEEHELTLCYGERYRIYQRAVSMLLPWPARKRSAAQRTLSWNP